MDLNKINKFNFLTYLKAVVREVFDDNGRSAFHTRREEELDTDILQSIADDVQAMCDEFDALIEE